MSAGSHPKPDDLSEAAIRVEVALERHCVSDDDVRQRVNGDAQKTWQPQQRNHDLVTVGGLHHGCLTSAAIV